MSWAKRRPRPHPYVPAAGDPQSCAACRLIEANQVHDPANLPTPTAEQRAHDAAVLGEHEE